jgi:hypothetical protein
MLFAWFLSNLHCVTRPNFSFRSFNMERFSLKFVYDIHIRIIKWQEIEGSGVIPSPSLIWSFLSNGPFDTTFFNLFEKKILNTTKWQNCSQCLHRRENNVKLENDYVLVSTPSGIHSHKPPLWPLLRDFGLLQTDDQCLEIFGRYLLPNTVTVGNQCLLFQDKDVFFSWTKHYVM